MEHCIETIERIVASDDEPGRLALLQLGYNLGRLSELTGLGRAEFWDRWKPAVDQWDRPALRLLAQGLRDLPTIG